MAGGPPTDHCAKVEEYRKIHEPFVMNDIPAQQLLLDRRKVFRVLADAGIPVPPHVIVR